MALIGLIDHTANVMFYFWKVIFTDVKMKYSCINLYGMSR